MLEGVVCPPPLSHTPFVFTAPPLGGILFPFPHQGKFDKDRKEELVVL